MNFANLTKKVSSEQTALLIIDMQKDYCCEGGVFHRTGFDVEIAKSLAIRLNIFLNQARKVLKHIVHLKMTKLACLSSPAALEHYQRLGIERHYDPAYSDFYEVVPVEGELVIPKYRHSGFVSTYLEHFLRIGNVKTLILTGLATNVCIESTARDGFARDYHIVVPEDLTEGTSNEAKKWSLINIDSFFGEIVKSEDLLHCWGIKG
jgi:ureidoacrylate peracid hydrolase